MESIPCGKYVPKKNTVITLSHFLHVLQDSMGTSETLGRGSIQFMTAGTGVRHSEHNRDPETPLRFIQVC